MRKTRTIAAVTLCAFACTALLLPSSCASTSRVPLVADVPEGAQDSAKVGLSKSKTGEVSIIASEPMAEISVNGELVGTGMAVVLPKSASLEIVATHPDYYDFTRTVFPSLRVADMNEP